MVPPPPNAWSAVSINLFYFYFKFLNSLRATNILKNAFGMDTRWPPLLVHSASADANAFMTESNRTQGHLLPNVGGTLIAPEGQSARDELKNNRTIKRNNISESQNFYVIWFNQ